MIEIGRRRFRPRPWPTIVALAGIAVLLGLGTWQLQRLEWKQAMIAERAARMAEPAMALPKRIVDPAALEHRPVRLAGRFLHDKELYLPGRSHRRQGGLHVMTPFVLEDGRAVLVDRGWVPPDAQAPATRAEGQVAGPVVVEGFMMVGGWRGAELFRPANQPADNLWIWPDLPAMAAHAGLERARDLCPAPEPARGGLSR
jgi:surfeit locus 1 family protein